MGEAKRRKMARTKTTWAEGETLREEIALHWLCPVPEINGAYMRELTGNQDVPEVPNVILNAFRAEVGGRTFHVGFCLGDGETFSAVGVAVVSRLAIEVPDTTLHVVRVQHEDIAWDIVLRHLRSFTGELLVFAFPDSDTYDAGLAETHYSKHVRQFGPDGEELRKLTAKDRQEILARKAEILQRPPPPKFYDVPGIMREDAPWVFGVVTPAGKALRTAIWNGRRNYAYEFPEDICRYVGGDRIAIVQVDRPVGVNRRSSVDLTHRLSGDFDGIIRWARDTETYQSILNSFIRLDFESVGPADPPEGWVPQVTIMTAGMR